jgi:pyruvate,water dikinase
MVEERRFPSPFEIKTPPGAEGWESMYPYHTLFSEERREYDEGQLWFWDALHCPKVQKPWEMWNHPIWHYTLSSRASRVFCVPPSNGISHRVLNGYFYISANAVTDPKVMEERAPLFMKRTGDFYEHWDERWENWLKKAMAVLNELNAIEFKDLPHFEDESVAAEENFGSGTILLNTFDRYKRLWWEMWELHHHPLTLTYLAYVMFYDFCTKAFPGMSPNAIAKMIAGAPGLDMFRPQEELAKLSKLAISLGVADIFKQELKADETISRLETTDAGKKWLEEMEKSKEPWFWVSPGTAYNAFEVPWIDDLSIPFGYIRGYIEKLEKGESIDRDIEGIIKERDRITEEYRNLLPTDEDKKAFDQTLGTTRKAYPFAEKHLFYADFWFLNLHRKKGKELGRVLTNAGFFKELEDIFYFAPTELEPMLEDLCDVWAVPGIPARGPGIWPKEVERRKRILAILDKWSPPPALGPIPELITEPFTIQLYGITSDSLEAWLAPKPKPEEVTELKGFPASAGAVEGPARVILSYEYLNEVQPGEILVCPCTSPSWAPVFPKIKAAVTDLGGMSCHAAIVCREYGLPSVVGTGFATKIIKNGDKLKVDGSTGIVNIVR